MSKAEEEPAGEAASQAAAEGQEEDAAQAASASQEHEQEAAALPPWWILRPRGSGTIRRMQRRRAAGSEGQEHMPEDASQQPSPDDEHDDNLKDAKAALKRQGSPHEGTELDPATLAARWVTEDGGQWLILACIPRVAHCLPGSSLAVADLRTRVAASTPPRASRLTVHYLFAPDHKALDIYPYIASANRRCLLLCASQRYVDEPLTRLDGFIGKELGLDDEHADKAYFLFKRTTTGSGRHVFQLPKFTRMINPGNACLVDDGDKDDFYGIETTRFIPYVGLHYWSTGRSNQWLYRNLTYPQSLRFRPWGAHGTIYHNCKIWWVDLSCGLLYGVPHDMVHGNGTLSFVALPDGCNLPAGTSDLDKRRCVGVSAGKLRYVQTHKLRCRNGEPVPVVSMWTLIDEATGEWHRECRTPLKWIWDELEPDKLPAVALIHPNHGDVVYFFKQFWIVGVNVREGRVLEWQFNAMFHPPLPYHSSRFVRPWLVTRELLAVWTESSSDRRSLILDGRDFDE